MKTEKPLSKKANQIQKECRRFYFEEDVKEAVEKLKEYLIEEIKASKGLRKNLSVRMNNKMKYLEVQYERLLEEIDKIFGDFTGGKRIKWK